MEFNFTFILVSVLVIAVWLIIEFKRLKHKLFAIFLIGLILFTYISFSVSLGGKDINYKTPSGIIEGTQLYMSWLASSFTKAKSITAYAIKTDWKQYDEEIKIIDLNSTENITKTIWDKF